MSYIFSNNGNNYTFKKLDNMLINMPETDGHHILIRETVDGVPQYLWGSAACIVKANEAYIFEYTPTSIEAFQGEWEWYALPSGSYLMTTTVTEYLFVDVFNDCVNRWWVRGTRGTCQSITLPCLLFHSSIHSTILSPSQITR